MNHIKSKPLVSVILPCYNVEEYVKQTLDSLINQTLKDIEIIAIDDGSTDKTLEILEKSAQSDPRITIIKHKKNCGVSAAKNTGLQNTKADYIALTGADDISLPKKLEKQIAFLKTHPEIAILGTNVLMIDEKGKIFAERHYPENHAQIKKGMIVFNQLADPSIMINRKLTGEFKYTSTKQFEDMEIAFKILNNQKAHNLQENLVMIRRRAGQQTFKNIKEMLIITFLLQSKWLFVPGFFSIKGLVFWLAKIPLFIMPDKIIELIYSKMVYTSLSKKTFEVV